MTKYQKGYRIETKIRKELEKEGFYTTRNAGSHGFWDVLALSENEVKLIQVKSIKGKKYYESKEIEKFRKLKTPKNVNKYLYVWKDYKGIIKKEQL